MGGGGGRGVGRGGGGGGGALRCNIEFLGSGKWFDAPQHIPYVFVVTVENKMHTGKGECYAAGASAFDTHNFIVKNHKSRKYILSYSAL